MLSFVILNDVMLDVVRWSVVMLNVPAPMESVQGQGPYSFPLFTNRPNKLECYIKLEWKVIPGTNNLAY
jgi:hypothetical protein